MMNLFSLVAIQEMRVKFIPRMRLCLDSPNNCNYISIFTRKSTMKKIDLSIISNSEQWKMLKIEVEQSSKNLFIPSIHH